MSAVLDPKEVQRERDVLCRMADELRSLTNTLNTQRGKEALTSAALHLEQCIHNCDDTINALKGVGRTG